MRMTLRALLALLAVMAFAVGLAACGGGDEETAETETAEETDTGVTTPNVDPIQRDPANADTRITIGSKNFAEQYVLGEIYAQALEAAGFDVRKELDLGSEQIAFRALRRGDIDAYPEYTGTALTSFYRVETADVPRDREEAFEMLQQRLEEDNITAMPQTPFENTYRVASTKETAEKYGNPQTLTELVQAIEESGDEVSLSGFPECRQRTDCYLGLQRVYDWSPRFVSSEGQYADLDSGQADFTMAFSTDGPLSTGKYVTYEDDQGLFPPYFVSLLTRDDAAEKLGESGQEVITRVQEPLTEEVMQELNARVVLDKQRPERVARDYLREAGFVEESS